MNRYTGTRVRAYGGVEADAPGVAKFCTFSVNGEEPVMMGDELQCIHGALTLQSPYYRTYIHAMGALEYTRQGIGRID